MSFFIGKITRKVSKQHNEYFVGKVNAIPVRGSWAKKGQDDIFLFLDIEKINFLAKGDKPGSETVSQEEPKEQ